MAHKKSKNDKEKIFLEEFDGFTPGIEGYVGFLELELKKCSEKLNIVPKIEIRVLEIEKRLSRIQDINGRLDTRLLEFETKISDLSERSLKLEKSFEKALPSFKPIKNLLSRKSLPNFQRASFFSRVFIRGEVYSIFIKVINPGVSSVHLQKARSS